MSGLGSVAFAQDEPTPIPSGQTQQPQRDDTEFPWGLLGLLGLGGLAGLTRRDAPTRRIETVDASRQRS